MGADIKAFRPGSVYPDATTTVVIKPRDTAEVFGRTSELAIMDTAGHVSKQMGLSAGPRAPTYA